MAFGNRQNTNNNSVDANTQGLQFFNLEGFDPSTLQVGYWNNFISFKINPALAENKREESKKYDYEKFVSCLLSPQKAYELYIKLYNYFIPEFIEDPMSVESIGIPSGQGLIVISNGLDIKGNKKSDPAICITIYVDIDANTKTENYLSYEFRKGNIIKNYNCDEGSYDEDFGIQAEFLMFVLSLKEFAKASTQAYAHSIRYTDRFYRAKEISISDKIVEKLGIQIESKKKNGNQSSPFSNRRAVGDSRTSTPIDSGDIDDVHRELEG